MVAATTKKCLSLEEFVSFMEDNINEFSDTWRMNQKRNPEDWREDGMGLADWLEQFDMVMSD